MPREKARRRFGRMSRQVLPGVQPLAARLASKAAKVARACLSSDTWSPLRISARIIPRTSHFANPRTPVVNALRRGRTVHLRPQGPARPRCRLACRRCGFAAELGRVHRRFACIDRIWAAVGHASPERAHDTPSRLIHAWPSCALGASPHWHLACRRCGFAAYLQP